MTTAITIDNVDLNITADSITTATDGYILSGANVRISFSSKIRSFYRHGWHSWSLSGWLPDHIELRNHKLPLERVKDEDVQYEDLGYQHSSSVAAVELQNGKIILLGGLGLDAHIVLSDDQLTGSYETGEGAWFITAGAETLVFSRYSDHLGKIFLDTPVKDPLRIWCSWYSLYRLISEKNLSGILDSLEEFPFDVFQIDDGWQKSIGDWQANGKFPSGMAYLAKRISEKGFMPGIWIAPFIVQEKSTIFQDRKEWLVKDPEGNPTLVNRNWGDNVYVLDTTNQAVQEWLAGLIRQLVSWGYTYIKLDFLYAAGFPGNREKDLGREETYREALRLIREVAGDAYIMACGAPVIPSLGLCDSIRVGPDVGPFWENFFMRLSPINATSPSAHNAMFTSISRMWLKKLVNPDPDAVYFRSKLLSLTRAQKEYQHDLAMISNVKVTSDFPAWLKRNESDGLKLFLEAKPAVKQIARHRYQIDGRIVDFNKVMHLKIKRPFFPVAIIERLAFYWEYFISGFPAFLMANRLMQRSLNKITPPPGNK